MSIATCDDAKRLYSGFDLCNPNTSVSMTINGPAPIILAFYLNAAIDQQVEAYLKEQGSRINSRVLSALAMRVADDPFKKVKKMIKDLF